MSAPLLNNSRDGLPDSLRHVLAYAAIAPGNQARFSQAKLIDENGQLVADWPTAFRQLRPLEKADVRSHPGAFLAQADDVVYRGTTSGTASAAFTYFAGETWNRKRVEARQRSLAWWGIDVETPILNLASRLGPVRLQDSSLVGKIDIDFVEQLLQILTDEPVIIRGYPSRLCEVAVALHRHRLTLSSEAIVAVIATGECLFEAQRVLLNKTFCGPVINEYGCQESGVSGLSCPEVGRLHLDGDRCLYEKVEGTLLTTDLYNTTQPMIRYRSGDILHLYSETCPCGRPGLTAKILGREEALLTWNNRTGNQKCWPGEIELPAFESLLSYQIQLQPDGRRLWVQPETGMQPAALTPLKTWFEESFGADPTEVLLEASIHQASVGLEAVSSETWLAQVTGQAWLTWLDQPLPWGEAQAIAALLKQLVAPCHTVLQGLSPLVLRQVDAIAQSQPARNSHLEAMKIRVLLWSAVLMAESDIDIQAFYARIIARFKAWAKDHTTLSLAQFSALGFDLLAPLLTVETLIARSQWPAVHDIVQHYWPQRLKADTFTVHHYLTVLDVASHNAQQNSHPWVPALNPLSAILLGDFYRTASTLTLNMVEAWAEMIHNCPGALMQSPPASAKATDFCETWQVLRQALLRKDKKQVSQQLETLFRTAQSPEQIAQCWLEKGYAALVFKDAFDPMQWVDLLKEQIGVLGQPCASGSQSQKSVVNPLPWVPILKALAPELTKIGQPELAYACLFAAAPPNRKLSLFDRQSRGANGKQSVISTTDQGL